ncbi:hypothetical protein DID88_003608 [Monilinia fructigena]|uniref:Peptidase M16 N-terminal domain-containing protein n=1 Tax=Monilinia fructigena TaxID=38457 RepID=A0A395IUP2_9HELO|nr:hypothetical protein DID88_003608 [Monilinia fructigena]
MDVNVGNFSDPEDFPGMAHAVEHLLFMGTKKYPVGMLIHNTFPQIREVPTHTQVPHLPTNYFEVAAKSGEDGDSGDANPSPLHGALDRFAQFFIDLSSSIRLWTEN